MSTFTTVTSVEHHQIVRIRTFHPLPSSLLDLLHQLHVERATGQLILHISQGSVGAAQFEEKARITTGE